MIKKLLYKLSTPLKFLRVSLILIECMVISILFKHERPSFRETGQNILISGPGLSNKGDQAMLFTTVDQLKQRFPDKKIFVLNTENYLNEQEAKYNFGLLPWDREIMYSLCGVLGSIFSNSPYRANKNIRNIYLNTFFIMDLSGYALSSQWGFSNSFGYLINFLLARRYGLPLYVFPQSIGPFDYSFVNKAILFPLMKLCLPYPRIIMLRQGEDINPLNMFTKNNVKHYPDIVLQRESLNLTNVFVNQYRSNKIDIQPNSVGIFPSQRISERVDNTALLDLYISIIKTLIDSQKTVYILRHSFEDLEICQLIADRFIDNDHVKFIPDEIDAIQLENVIANFEIVVASRYHSIIHSYRQSVPALVIGWAPKYQALVRLFNQSQYLFDCRESINSNEVILGLKNLLLNQAEEKKSIENSLSKIKETNSFSIFDECTP